jgi:carbonic anhydrase
MQTILFLALIFTFTVEAKTIPQKAKKEATHKVDAHATSHAPPISRMTGWEAFAEMQNGNMRFHEGKSRHPNQDIPTRDALANGQKPHTIILSCSDSRLAPETIFDQGLGDVFVVRLAGNVINAEAVASIEYAIAHLGSKLLLVMGHESCGAVGAAIQAKPGVSNGSESLDVLVKHIRSHLTPTSVESAAIDKSFRQSVKENVSATMSELLEKSEIVRGAAASDGLILGNAIYSLKTGKVEFWDMGMKVAGQKDSSSVVVADGPAIKEQVVNEEIVTDKATAPQAKTKGKEKGHSEH